MTQEPAKKTELAMRASDELAKRYGALPLQGPGKGGGETTLRKRDDSARKVEMGSAKSSVVSVVRNRLAGQ